MYYASISPAKYRMGFSQCSMFSTITSINKHVKLVMMNAQELNDINIDATYSIWSETSTKP